MSLSFLICNMKIQALAVLRSLRASKEGIYVKILCNVIESYISWFKTLQWFPQTSRINSKLPTLAHRAPCDLVPAYLSDDTFSIFSCILFQPQWLSCCALNTLNCTHCSILAMAVPSACNTLLHMFPSLRCLLKYHPFREDFPAHLN